MPRVTQTTVLPLLVLCVLCGCTTVPLDNALRNFNYGRIDEADRDLASIPPGSSQIMHLMERGMIRHLRRDYSNSTADWLQAVKLEKELETHSASRASASMLVNDTLLDYRGYPFERTYLHVYLAKNYLAQGLWQEAGVEARAIALALAPAKLDGFPDDSFSHYIAAFCLELNGDDSNAAMQYRQAAKLAPGIGIDCRTGRFMPATNQFETATGSVLVPSKSGAELVCFIDLDGVNGVIPQYADLYADGIYLGRSRTLSNTLDLEIVSSERMKTRRAAKSLGRLALKGAVALAASSKDNDLGQMVWMMLLATETEDYRRWSTLPTQLAVARVPCPENLREFAVDIKGSTGITLRRLIFSAPIPCLRRIYVAVCRDHPP
jgi:hypothetical protein